MRIERSGRRHYIDEDFGVKLVLVLFSGIPIFMFQCFYQKQLKTQKSSTIMLKKFFNDNAKGQLISKANFKVFI